MKIADFDSYTNEDILREIDLDQPGRLRFMVVSVGLCSEDPLFAEGVFKRLSTHTDPEVRGNRFKIEIDLGQPIGTNPAGDAASHLRVFVRDGNIQTAFPYTP